MSVKTLEMKYQFDFCSFILALTVHYPCTKLQMQTHILYTTEFEICLKLCMLIKETQLQIDAGICIF